MSTERFRTISMDPPWPERGAGKCKRGADRHYPLMKPADIYRTIVTSEPWQQIDADAHLYCWVTNNYLPDGLRLVADLGFRYVTNICWVKNRAGLGQYFRGQHELCLFAVRGSGYETRTERRDLCTVLDMDDDVCIGHPRGAHSAKPETFHELIELRSKGPYVEFFARQQRAGWTAWGNEIAEAAE